MNQAGLSVHPFCWKETASNDTD